MDQTSKSKLGFGHGSIIAAPIPLKNPALGTGLIGTAGYMFKLDEDSNTSFIGAAGLYTNNGSMGAGLAANLYFGDGRWAIKALYGRADINYAMCIRDRNDIGRHLGKDVSQSLVNSVEYCAQGCKRDLQLQQFSRRIAAIWHWAFPHPPRGEITGAGFGELNMITVTRARFGLAQSFTISRGSKNHADVLTVRVTRDGVTGWGECVPYPRYGDTQDSVTAQIAALPEGISRAGVQAALPPGSARNAVAVSYTHLDVYKRQV